MISDYILLVLFLIPHVFLFLVSNKLIAISLYPWLVEGKNLTKEDVRGFFLGLFGIAVSVAFSIMLFN